MDWELRTKMRDRVFFCRTLVQQPGGGGHGVKYHTIAARHSPCKSFLSLDRWFHDSLLLLASRQAPGVVQKGQIAKARGRLTQQR